jgi:hypothetical protein
MTREAADFQNERSGEGQRGHDEPGRAGEADEAIGRQRRFGCRLQKLRWPASQAVLIKVSGLNPSIVSQIESGKKAGTPAQRATLEAAAREASRQGLAALRLAAQQHLDEAGAAVLDEQWLEEAPDPTTREAARLTELVWPNGRMMRHWVGRSVYGGVSVNAESVGAVGLVAGDDPRFWAELRTLLGQLVRQEVARALRPREPTDEAGRPDQGRPDGGAAAKK